MECLLYPYVTQVCRPLLAFRVLALETQKGRTAAPNLGTTLCTPNYL